MAALAAAGDGGPASATAVGEEGRRGRFSGFFT